MTCDKSIQVDTLQVNKWSARDAGDSQAAELTKYNNYGTNSSLDRAIGDHQEIIWLLFSKFIFPAFLHVVLRQTSSSVIGSILGQELHCGMTL